MQCLLCLDAGDGAAVARVELTPVKLAIVLDYARRTTGHSLTWITALDVQIGPAAGHRVTRAFPVEVDINLRDGASTTVLALIVQTLPFPLSKSLLLLILEVRVAVKTRLLAGSVVHVKESLFNMEGWT